MNELISKENTDYYSYYKNVLKLRTKLISDIFDNFID